jgi:hypothetical protein
MNRIIARRAGETSSPSASPMRKNSSQDRTRTGVEMPWPDEAWRGRVGGDVE